MRAVLWIAVWLVGAAGAARAQVNNTNMPSAEVLARADRYDPPRLGQLAAKLATQPDMTGTWVHAQPADACRGPLFDPAHAVCPFKPVPGEATFGPLPGTAVTSIPYKPAYQKIYDQHVAEALQGKARDTFATCVPYGVPRMIGESPAPFDIVQAPDLMFWYNNYARSERRIFLDGRPHPAIDGPNSAGPTYSGHSVGHWEGNTLVVDTVNMIPAFFDETSSPHSDQLRVTERLRLLDVDLIENQITLTDPVAFERPWVVTRYYRRFNPPPPGDAAPSAPGAQAGAARNYLELNDRLCVPNVKLDKDGFQVVLLPQELEAQPVEPKARPKPKSKTRR